ncbi:MAG: hypothetical protein KGK17_04825 [Betaproteobacteria bacterium]|nr:hypothetical protein [Betaproteobacteria bacterium]
MARLTAAQRKALPDSAFAGPNRTYPVNDAAHAKAAIMLKGQGMLSAPQQASVVSKAKKVLKRGN